MNIPSKISLIDSNIERREQIAELLLKLPRKIFCFGVTSELPRPALCGGLYLAFDEANGLKNLINHLEDSLNPCSIVALSEEIAVDSVVEAIRAGVSDYVSWPTSNDRLLSAIQTADRELNMRTKVVSREVRAKLLIEKLTKREHEVIHGISVGWTSAEIGSLLGISSRTVEIHRSNALKKLNARNSYEALRIVYDATNGEHA